MILINGNFLCRNLTGIERFAFEICRCLDELLSENKEEKPDFSILVPENAKTLPAYKNIDIIKTFPLKSFPRWDMFYFSKACRKLNAKGLNFSNTAPYGKNCGYAFIHDIYAKDFPEDFSSKKDKLIKLYSCFHYKNIARHAEKIFTVSEFSKNQIIKAYGTDASKITVIPNGWEHFKKVEPDDGIFKKFPSLLEKDFYFTLGSLQKRKNLKWINEYALKHPKEHFAVSGKAIGGMHSSEIGALENLKNVILLGYVTDGEVKSLMKKCKAFVFPSYYEGFGIPPLEALSEGAKIIVSKSASLPEIYGNTAAYIDSENTDVSLEKLSKNEPAPQDVKSVLEKYTYRNAAKLLLKEFI